MLSGRRIVLGVSGGIAAYKAAILARRLQDHGATVRCVMTHSAAAFLGPATLAGITGRAPTVDLFDDTDPSPHTTLARWADAIVVAPATTATLARLAHGLTEDALSATVVAAWGKPVVIAPAMHTEMWDHPATRRNVARLTDDGYHLVGPASGHLAGGDQGPGRMVEPEEIVDALERARGGGDLAGWSVLVSAGGTREAIDPVRYIGNRSSGKMGHAIALAAVRRGATVTLVTAAAPPPPQSGLETVTVETAEEMAEAVWAAAEAADVAVLAAAVADFRPVDAATTKLRRSAGAPVIELTPTPDILAGVAASERRPFLVGFAAETGSLDGAVDKAMRKGVDLLVGNDVAATGSGFGSDTNRVVIITPDGATDPWELMSKDEVAERLWDRIHELRRGDGADR